LVNLTGIPRGRRRSSPCYPFAMHETVGALERGVKRWRESDWPRPAAMVISGSGLGADPSEFFGSAPIIEAPLADLVPFEVRAIAGHHHRVEIYETAVGHVLYQRGRVHAYQGYDPHEVVFTVRLAGLLGAETLILSNAAGGIRPDWPVGTLCVLRDHINATGMNPLAAELPEDWGSPFPDMTEAYSRELRAIAFEIANGLDFNLEEGVYYGVSGPSFETPAEIVMMRTLGADLVGMSTVLEVIAARHLGLACLGFSLVTNPAAGVSTEPIAHEIALEAGQRASSRFTRLWVEIVQALSSSPRKDNG